MVRFVLEIIRQAKEKEQTLPNAADNQYRSIRWKTESLDAWRAELSKLILQPPNGWTAAKLQRFTHAVLTFVNQLPGTTQVKTNTNGKGEARSWRAAVDAYLKGMSAADPQWPGKKLFDAGNGSWTEPRHKQLLDIALGGTDSDTWKGWPPLPAQP